MDVSQLRRFDLTFPGYWIDGPDRDWAFETDHILRLAEDELVKAVASYALFVPITANNVEQYFAGTQSKYEKCLNSIYATTFVYSLDAITNLLKKLDRAPKPVNQLRKKYRKQFGHLNGIRDSVAHIEDRGRGLDKNNKPIPGSIIVLGAFFERRFEFTSKDGSICGVEISEATLLLAHEILQSIINAYDWIPVPNMGVDPPRIRP